MSIYRKNLFVKLCCIASFSCCFERGFSQRIKNESAIRSIQADHYFRFYYENDFVALTDYYYTSGMNIELVKPSLKKNPVNKLFFCLPGAKMKYGLALDHFAFTPRHIYYSDILYNDRPYAGCISISSFRIATDENRKLQLASSLELGLTGPGAFWKPVQTFLHKRLIPAPEPEGWDNQIKNDLILNYKINLEKNLIHENSFLLNGNIETIAGTMNDKLATGLSIMIGKLSSPFESYETNKSEKISGAPIKI